MISRPGEKDRFWRLPGVFSGENSVAESPGADVSDLGPVSVMCKPANNVVQAHQIGSLQLTTIGASKGSPVIENSILTSR